MVRLLIRTMLLLVIITVYLLSVQLWQRRKSRETLPLHLREVLYGRTRWNPPGPVSTVKLLSAKGMLDRNLLLAGLQPSRVLDT